MTLLTTQTISRLDALLHDDISGTEMVGMDK